MVDEKLTTWKKTKLIVSGITFIFIGILMIIGQLDSQDADLFSFAITAFFLLFGSSLILKSFGIYLSKSIDKLKQNKTFQRSKKILFWILILILGIMAISGVAAFLVWIGPLVIIIILLILILLNMR